MSSKLSDEIAKISGRRVLVCPLDWGLGHATRCTPIVRALLAAGKQVILAADGGAYRFLQTEFPDLQIVRFAGLTVCYSASQSQVGAMLWQLPKFAFQIAREHRNLREIIEKNQIDCVISDNRFGLWTRQSQCVYITHQLMVKMSKSCRFAEKMVWRLHQRIIKKYDFCWIPDDENSQLSGDLAHKYSLPKNAHFIGIISRFEKADFSSEKSEFDRIGLVSGPEPQRTIFEKQLTEFFSHQNGRCLIVRGLPACTEKQPSSGNVEFCNHLKTSELQRILSTTPRIFCRSGYSTVMDLMSLGKTATLIPTPGQTEQEYLVDYLQKFGFEKLTFEK